MTKYKLPYSQIFIGIIAAVPMALGLPARALEVQVLPKNPQLGDTISVVIEANAQEKTSNPTVTVGEITYPAFEIAPRQYRSFVPTTPLEKAGVRTIKISEDGQEQNISVKVRDRKFPVQRITLPPGKAGVDATEYELKRVKELKALQTPEKYWSSAFLAPNAGRTSTKYGVRRYYNGEFAKDYYHRGQDYAGGEGSRVIAPAAGRVALVGTVSQGFRVHGNVVGIDHGQGVVSIFMHLSRINVKEGDFVQAGQKIGAVGSTGASTGPHLHWGLYVNGQSVDPLPWKAQKID
ncbi:M23 family metallopeptidase [Dolichospermum sp. ST_sed3]|nr:M23 family metallopeptidase [Dolichospermum sp. ST_sed9]MDD1434710.1 M23 family metallopeptidase [Dolichospermum sp. ST_sed6]MDD1443878.1 M23 family metallopeptidase [Dolichospermum sp. ST_sed3]MDD1458458.1 M23 family metallopeptidase [Dolichospermum sp. ST_sed7]MDD1463593.1 M23 family metallopeptidase [Dolichospermum sp. ST_sed2]MDD1469469.1 M23 family metallopeptidase [Dolichospermum sp. ST_sed5]MDD1474918.1 M23 family metallopeptidase [Dolichospermum sp. ST_sed4]